MSQRFIVTKEHRRFTEFADAVRRGHTIGLCFGSAGVGETLSARRYAQYEKAHDLLTYWGPRSDNDAKIYAALNRSRIVLYTPSVLTTPRTLKDELTQAITRTNMCIEQHLVPPGTATPEAWGWRHGRNYVGLIIVDEAERLRPAALELLRDRYDRDDITLILIGMPGLEKQFSHYPPVLQPSRLRPPVPAPGTRRTAVRPRATLAIPRQDPRPRRLHRRPSHRSHRTDHPRQLPAPRTPLPPDPAGPEDRRTRHHHQRRHRSRTEHPGHRCHLTPPRSDRRTPPFSRRSHSNTQLVRPGHLPHVCCQTCASAPLWETARPTDGVAALSHQRGAGSAPGSRTQES